MKIEGPTSLSFPEGGKPSQGVTLSAIQYAVLTTVSHLQEKAIAQAPPMKSTGPASVAPPQARAKEPSMLEYDLDSMKYFCYYLKAILDHDHTKDQLFMKKLDEIKTKCSSDIQILIQRKFQWNETIPGLLDWLNANIKQVKGLISSDNERVATDSMDIICFLVIGSVGSSYTPNAKFFNELWALNPGGGFSLSQALSKYVIAYFLQEDPGDQTKLKNDLNDFLILLPQDSTPLGQARVQLVKDLGDLEKNKYVWPWTTVSKEESLNQGYSVLFYILDNWKPPNFQH